MLHTVGIPMQTNKKRRLSLLFLKADIYLVNNIDTKIYILLNEFDNKCIEVIGEMI